MRDLLATNDPVLLSFVSALLSGEGFQFVVLDQNISILEGSIGIFPRRLAVSEDDWDQAARLMRDADLGQWIKDDGAR
ncbi:MAG: hypothetical protein CTY31_10255 [Hyphomicrobium sp.]|jgi:hypothetical protein|nr:MAG: hypothetical protein CTY39_10350 [Hyphomicrobium sp.]PPC99338.1 MAG: hypothetical protein CTY31_10255 [Hyphomicrobium sp.]